jgi:hypothetical protein
VIMADTSVFDIDKARADGHSDDDILGYIKKMPSSARYNFDFDSAQRDGYASTDILDHIKSMPLGNVPVDRATGMSAPPKPDVMSGVPRTPTAGEQGQHWGKGIFQDLQAIGQASPGGAGIPMNIHDLKGTLAAPMDLFNKLMVPVENLAMRYVDPTAALGGRVLNMEQNRPFESDPEARQGIQAVLPMLAAGGSFLKQTPLTDAEYEAAIQKALQSDKLTYKQAKEFMDRLPETRAAMENAMRDLRLGTRKAAKAEAGEATAAAKKTEQETITPLQEQKRALQTKQSTEGSALSVKAATGSTQSAQELRSLATEREAAKTAMKEQATKKAQELARDIGTRLKTDEVAGLNVAGRKKAMTQFNNDVTKEYDTIREIANNHIEEVPTGEKADVGIVDPSGKPILQDVTRPMALPSERLTNPKLQMEYDRLKDSLKTSVQQGSPGAATLIQYMESKGPVPLQNLIDDLSTVNQIRYSKADAAIRTKSERLASMTADAIRDSIKAVVAKLPPEEGKAVDKALENAKAILARRDALLGTAQARTGAQTMEIYGEVGRLTDKPAVFKGWWNSTTPQVREAARGQMVDDLLGNSYQDFARNWNNLHPEIKATAFTPDEISRVDQAAKTGPEGVRKVVADYNAKIEASKQAAEAQKVAIATERQRIRGYGEQIRDLEARIQKTGGDIADSLTTAKKRIETQRDTALEGLTKELDRQSAELRTQARAAQEAIERRRLGQRALWYGMGALGGWNARNAFEALFNLGGAAKGGSTHHAAP